MIDILEQVKNLPTLRTSIYPFDYAQAMAEGKLERVISLKIISFPKHCRKIVFFPYY
ncbi:MAG: hypothetical protein ACI8P3_003772 [Saprospiraceae bacterium]|jgi:hypothetical protein